MNQRRQQRILELENQLAKLKSGAPCQHDNIGCNDCGRETNISKLSELLTLRFKKLQNSWEACQASKNYDGGGLGHLSNLTEYHKNAGLYKNIVDKLLDELDKS